MSLIKHAQRIAAKAKAAADDLDAIHPADDADTTFVKESLRGHRAARDVLPAAALLDALGPAGLRRLQSPEGLGLIVQVPAPDWIPHVETALRGVTDFAHIFSRNGSSKTQHRASEGNDQACSLLSQGARVAGVSHAPDRYLPAALVAGADLIVRIGPPSNRIVAHVIREVTGKRARHIPSLVAATLGFDALTGSIRLGSSPAACIARIQAAAGALSGVDPLLGDIPALDELHGYGPALDWAKRLVADLDAWRAGQLRWEDISRCCLLSSEPGLGKTTLVRAIAKAAKLPLISTGVSQWMTPSGYLNDVIQSAEDAFARAAAQSPALLFIDETDSIPSRVSMDSRRKDYWTPLFNSVLTNIDLNNSGVNSRLIIIGATNHAEALDPALVRPGRLHPTIRIGRPSPGDLVGIMRQHLGGDLDGVDLEGVALLGAGSTGADVTAWVNPRRPAAGRARRGAPMPRAGRDRRRGARPSRREPSPRGGLGDGESGASWPAPGRARLGRPRYAVRLRTGHFDLSSNAGSVFKFVARSGARAHPTAHRNMTVRQPAFPIFVRKSAPSADQAAMAAWYDPAAVERRRQSWAYGDGDQLVEMHRHILTLHPRTGDGYFVLANKRGPYTETSHRARVPLQAPDVRGQQFVSMNRFQRRRLGAALASVGHLWLEFDPYGEDAQGRPLPYRGMPLDALMALILAAILEAGLPAPSYWTDSGRGLHAVWLCEALPAKAAPKVKRIMDALYGPVLNADGSVPKRSFADPDRDAQESRLAAMWRVFRDAGLDQGTQDSSRVLRLWGSYNPKAGKHCRRLWPSQIEDIQRCTVDAVGDAVLPLTRDAFRKRMAERAAQPAPVDAPKFPAPRRTRSANAYAGKMGVWERKFSDLMRLREHRGRIAVGQRHLWVFLSANAYAQAKGGAPETWAELLAPLACLTVADALDCLRSLGRRQKRHEAGETVEHDGASWNPLFHYSGAKMADKLGVTEEEANAAGLNLVRPGKGKAVPAIQRKAEKRIRDGAVPRADRADAKMQAGRQGLALRAEGKSADEAIAAIRTATGRGRTWAIEAMKVAAASPVEDVDVTVAPAPSDAPTEVRKSALGQVRFSGRNIGGFAPAPASAPSAPAVPEPATAPVPYDKPWVMRVSDITVRILVAPGIEYLVVDDPKSRWGRIVLDAQCADTDLPAHLEAYLPVRRRRAPRPVRSASRRRPDAPDRQVSRPGITAAEYRRLTRGF